MLALISPAKKLKADGLVSDLPSTEPDFLKDTNALAAVARKLSRSDLRQMMKISDNLADLNYQRFQTFKAKACPDETKQAVLTFAGDTYTGLDAETLSPKDLDFAQDHLRILSGLYGLLRPLDRIQPYRLEMGRQIKTKRGTSLYEFWGDRLAKALDKELKSHKSPTVVNLASTEYIKAARHKDLKSEMLDIVFRQEKNGAYKIIGLLAKQARGAMARYIIKNQLEHPKDLKSFDLDGYHFAPSQSEDTTYVFLRPEAQ